MTRQELIGRLRDGAGWIPGKRTCLDFGESGSVYLDGVAGEVGEQCGEADTVIRIGWADWQAVARGELDPVSAYLSGRLRIEGEMAPAMQLAARLAAHRAERSSR